MGSNRWSFSRLESRPQPAMTLQAMAEPPQLPYYEPRSASVSRHSPLPSSLTLLGIPPEVRDQIWETIFKDIRSKPRRMWYGKPQTEYDGLSLVCRQIYHEISYYWPRSIITKHRLQAFLDQPFSMSKLESFTSLSIELPFNLSAEFFSDMGQMLEFLAPFLQHLSVFFTGADAYGTQTFLHGCGNKHANPELKKLPIDGQGFMQRHRFINALAALRSLRTLELQNLNLPLLQSHILANKPYLRQLHIECDPRSSLHIPWRVKNCGRGLLIPATENFPPVKELYISGNAALLSVQVVCKLDISLQKLTWVCPDPARQSGSIDQNYLRDTSYILSGLRSNATGLHTLRICIEGAIYESLTAYGDLIGSVRTHLPHMLPLRNLELHIWSKSAWLGKEVIEAFPRGLERVYLSERLVFLDDMLAIVEKRYLKMVNVKGERKNESEVNEGLNVIDTETELGRTDFIPLRTGALTFLSYQYIGENGKAAVVREFEDLINHQQSDPDEGQNSDLEEVKLHEHDDGNDDDVSIGEARRISLIKLNGRLLDRARNKHLAILSPGAHIPFRTFPTSVLQTGDRKVEFVSHTSSGIGNSESSCVFPEESVSEHPAIEAAVKLLKPPSLSEVRTNDTGLIIGGFKDDCAYFGKERTAEEIFEREVVRKVDELEVRTYPVETEVGKKEHWICN